MKLVDCAFCENKNIPLNDSVKVDEQVYCNTCFEEHFPDEASLEEKKVEKEIDLTVCRNCSKDFGNSELKTIAGFPICSDCEIEIQNRAFPKWVKGFVAGLLLLVVFSCIWNWKYYSAYSKLNQSNAAFLEGNYVYAGELMQSACDEVPEVIELNFFLVFLKGIHLIQLEKYDLALDLLNRCQGEFPHSQEIPALIAQAQIGLSFDKKDYPGFLKAAENLLQLDSVLTPMSLLTVASAHACLYADKGDLESKESALLFIKTAKEKQDTNAEVSKYINRIEYRLATRQIIETEEFDKQFPNGWSKNE